MATYYTSYKLTNPMLERLSPIVKGRTHLHGVSLTALENRGLVYKVNPWNHADFGEPGAYQATTKGIEALKMARAEGW